MNINFSNLYKYAQKPVLFAPSTSSLWDDEHISKGMLEAHLDPDMDAASRKPEFIDASVKWISGLGNFSNRAKVLDLGCGPGFYTERFAKLGFEVTGVDFSRRSIEYARAEAMQKDLHIEYLYQNYLTIDYNNELDLIIIIYYDLGVLSDEDRDLLISKVYRGLKPGGLFICDLLTPVKISDNQSVQKSWDFYESSFWRPHPHICLYSHYVYPEDNAQVDQFVVIEEGDKIEVYHNWDHLYSPERIRSVLNRAGFTDVCYFSDVTGKAYSETSESICVVARK